MSVERRIRPAFAGLEAGRWIDPDGETRDVVVRLSADWRERPEDLEALPGLIHLQRHRVEGPAQPAQLVAPLEAGPAAQLLQHGIEVRVDLPGVGGNLQDHLDLFVIARAVAAYCRPGHRDPAHRRLRPRPPPEGLRGAVADRMKEMVKGLIMILRSMTRFLVIFP